MSLISHKIVVVWACLLCLGHGRQLVGTSERSPDMPSVTGQQLLKSDQVKSLAALLVALDPAAAFKQPLAGIRQTSRRQAIAAATLAAVGFPWLARAEETSTGAPAVEEAPDTMPYKQFLQSIVDKKVEKVIFMPPNGDEAYAVIGGKKVRMGQGWPVELANTPQSPRFVQRILKYEKVPYEWKFELSDAKKGREKGVYPKPGEKLVKEKRAPEPKGPGDVAKSVFGSTNYKTGEALAPTPRYYGGAAMALKDLGGL